MAGRGLPLVPTLMTAAALPVLLGFGIWQLQRAEWKANLLERLEEAPRLPPISLARIPQGSLDFRRATARCAGAALAVSREGAQSRDGRPGFVARVLCPAVDGQPPFEADLGWSARPDGAKSLSLDAMLSGILRDFGTAREPRFRLVAEAPPPGLGLAPTNPPTLADIPDNHRSYAIQWFSFAAILAVIYAAYVRRWRRAAMPGVDAAATRR